MGKYLELLEPEQSKEDEQEEWFKDKHPFHREFYNAGYSFEYVKACWDAWQQIERIELKPEEGGNYNGRI
ncbi:MAG: hypothetical protein ACOYJB_10135 [Christensenellaceae bacterium]|jgi:hypothetical protein